MEDNLFGWNQRERAERVVDGMGLFSFSFAAPSLQSKIGLRVMGYVLVAHQSRDKPSPITH